jgi:hypothetical protein
MKRIITLSIIALMLSSCGYVWVHNTKDDSAFYRDKNSCTQEARTTYPDTSKQSTGATTTNCSSNNGYVLDGYIVSGHNLNCTTKPVYNNTNTDTPSFELTMDRDRYWGNCIKGKGWHRQKR